VGIQNKGGFKKGGDSGARGEELKKGAETKSREEGVESTQVRVKSSQEKY
jgi:hypothetical protein